MAHPLRSLFTAIAGSIAVLGACNPATPDQAAQSEPESIDTAIEDQHAGHDELDMETLPIALRVAFMSGHVEAGLALYRAGAPDEAAKHLLHPVSETHAAERAGIEALGFKPAVFESVSAMLDAGENAGSIEPLLQEAEANIALMQTEAAGDPVAIIGFLMDTALEEYAIGVTDDVITDAGEYQDAYGFSVVALKIARRLDAEATPDLIAELNALTALWPSDGPVAASVPTPIETVSAQIAVVRTALAAL